MLIYQFHHYIKPEFVEAYKAAILENARKTLPEPGVIRFDILQDKNDPTHFSLFEVYRNEEARATHLETAHFKEFKQAVLDRETFARRGQGDEFNLLYPEPED